MIFLVESQEDCKISELAKISDNPQTQLMSMENSFFHLGVLQQEPTFCLDLRLFPTLRSITLLDDNGIVLKTKSNVLILPW